jgi:hypothetical protein
MEKDGGFFTMKSAAFSGGSAVMALETKLQFSVYVMVHIFALYFVSNVTNFFCLVKKQAAYLGFDKCYQWPWFLCPIFPIRPWFCQLHGFSRM